MPKQKKNQIEDKHFRVFGSIKYEDKEPINDCTVKAFDKHPPLV
jgi:hypothetical protein